MRKANSGNVQTLSAEMLAHTSERWALSGGGLVSCAMTFA